MPTITKEPPCSTGRRNNVINLTLAILFDGFTAEKVYDSPLGFVRFADQAAAGIMEFTPSDFPTVQQHRSNGITRLRTRFRIERGEAV